MDVASRAAEMAARIDRICFVLFKKGEITFNEWVVITSGVVEYKVNPVLPPAYNIAQAALLKEG